MWGQACTLALVLLRADGSTEFFKGTVTDVLRDQNTLVSFIPFTFGGGIFIILDNILILSNDEVAARAWFNNVTLNCKTYKATLKTGLKADATEAEKQAALEQNCFIRMSADTPEKSFNFNGVDWYYNSHRVHLKDSDDLLLPNYTANMSTPNYDEKKQTWTGKRRELASLLGRLNWWRLVHRKKHDDSPESKAIRYLYSKVTPPPTQNWDSRIEIADPDVLRGLCSSWRLRGTNPPCPAQALAVKPKRYLLAASDAATHAPDGSRRPRAAYVVYGPSPAEDKAYERVGEDNRSIALWELIAAADLIEQVTKIESEVCIILAIDNLNAKCWLDSLDSRNPEAQRYLQRIEQRLHESNCRLFTIYVPSDDNYADIPSRIGLEAFAKLLASDDPAAADLHRRRAATHRLLLQAQAEARGVFTLKGGHAGGSDVHKK